MDNISLRTKTDKIMDKFEFIKAIMVADKEDGIKVFENHRILESFDSGILLFLSIFLLDMLGIIQFYI